MAAQKRYSNLAPLSIQKRYEIAIGAMEYFSPAYQIKKLKAEGKSLSQYSITPLSSGDFPRFLESRGILNEANKYTESIRLLLESLAMAGILIEMGSFGKNVMLPKSYYYQKELTTIQSKSRYFLSSALGQDFLYALAAQNIVQITGNTPSGDPHAGTGIIVSEDAILTCAHVLNDMAVDDIQIFQGINFSIKKSITHNSIDVGLLYVKNGNLQYNTNGLPFRNPIIGEELIVLGYPKIPLAQEARLTLQRGEVTCELISTIHKDDVFLFSATARPGNSGGPILSRNGCFLGMVTRDLTYQDGTFSPHYAGVPTSLVAKATSELDPTLKLPLEDYQ